MSFDQMLSGRTERRLPIIVVVRLAPVERAAGDAEEKTYTDNISPHGARLFSKQSWRSGEEIRLTANNEEALPGNVIYCHKLEDNRYAVGVKFQANTVAWSIIRRFDGAPTAISFKSKPTIPQ